MSMAEVGRITSPADGSKLTVELSPDTETLVVENALTAVIYAAWGRQPTTTDWDFAIPGSSLFTIPVLGGESKLRLIVDYPGAVPATDVQAVVWASECRWPPFVAPIA